MMKYIAIALLAASSLGGCIAQAGDESQEKSGTLEKLDTNADDNGVIETTPIPQPPLDSPTGNTSASPSTASEGSASDSPTYGSATSPGGAASHRGGSVVERNQ